MHKLMTKKTAPKLILIILGAGLISTICLILWFKSHHGGEVTTTMPIKSQTWQENLQYHTSLLLPTHAVIHSPVDGHIITFKRNFGQMISKNTRLWDIESEQSQQNYSERLIAYLKAKEKLKEQEKNEQQQQQLVSIGAVAHNHHLQAKKELLHSRIDYLQSTHQLRHLCELLQLEWSKHVNLTLKDINTVEKLLTGKKIIHLNSPVDGILLPAPSNNKNQHDEYIDIGSNLKTGQIIAQVGKADELSAKVVISEQDMAQIHIGHSVSVQPLQHPNTILKGQVTAIKHLQHSESNPSSTVEITVKCPEKECKFYHNMRAQVSIHTEKINHAIHVPFSALQWESGNYYVQKKHPLRGWIKQHVHIKKTTTLGTLIEKGLVQGDIIARDYSML